MSEDVNALSVETPLRRPTSLSEVAYVAIRDLLITLRIEPGAPIYEEQLARQLGVGRSPVREAVKRLESERLVNIYPRRGTFASEVNITDLSLLTEVRAQLEGEAAFRAAVRASPPEREMLRGLISEIEACGQDNSALIDMDSRVHRSIYRCAHNRHLEATLDQYYNLILRIWFLFIDRLPAISEHVCQLEPLLQTIASGDAQHAREIVVGHVSTFERAVLSVL